MARILMYTTGWCPYCQRAEALLRAKGVTEMTNLRVDLQPELKSEMIEKSGRRTVPQIWIDERHVGGCDDLVALDRSGELDRLLGA